MNKGDLFIYSDGSYAFSCKFVEKKEGRYMFRTIHNFKQAKYIVGTGEIIELTNGIKYLHPYKWWYEK